MKKFLLSLLLAVSTSANATITEADRQEFLSKNYVANGGFENANSKWTASGGSFAHVSSGSNLLNGSGSATWDSSAATQTLSSTAITIPPHLKGKPGEASCDIMTPSGTATHLLQAWDGSVAQGAQTVKSSTTATKTRVPFVFPTSGTLQLRLKSVNANEPSITIDNCRLAEFEPSLKLTTTERDAVSSPAAGFIIYNTTDNKFDFYNGGSWVELATSSPSTRSITSADSTTTSDETIKLSGASFSLTLHTAVGNSGRLLRIIHNGTSLTQVYTLLSAQNILTPNGSIASGTYKLFTNGETLVLVSDGTNWIQMGHQAETPEADAGALWVTSSDAYSFTIASSTIAAGTAYTSPNGCLFIVSTSIAPSTTLKAFGNCDPDAATALLTYVSGPTAGNKSYTGISTTGKPVKAGVTFDRFIWSRQGQYVNARWEYASSGSGGTLGTGMQAGFLPDNLLPDTTNMVQNTQVLGAAYPAGATGISVLGDHGSGLWSGVNFPIAPYLSWSNVTPDYALFTAICHGGGTWSITACAAVTTAASRTSVQMHYKVKNWQP